VLFRSINVSLDSLIPEKFAQITGRDFFHQVWDGLNKAHELGFKIKLNVVAMRGINDPEFTAFAELALRFPFKVRFIEFMPVGNQNSWEKEKFISADEIRKQLEEIGELTPSVSLHGDGPARMYELRSRDGRQGAVGFISPISHHFCDRCNRLRLTSEGRLRACLLNDRETDLKALLRGDATDLEIMETIRQTVLSKPQGHKLQPVLMTKKNEMNSCSGRMSRIGG
jgi:cyclic pyranopterin phosphate synthase